jgi:hypothetical protein
MKMPLIVMQGVVLGTMACDKSHPPSRDADVIDSITTARCHREVKCDRVGDGKRFRDANECHRDLDVRAHVAIGTATCGAVDTTALGACLDAIERAQCDAADPFEGACGDDALCTRRSSHGTSARLIP